jgi:hypothetical protein
MLRAEVPGTGTVFGENVAGTKGFFGAVKVLVVAVTRGNGLTSSDFRVVLGAIGADCTSVFF